MQRPEIPHSLCHRTCGGAAVAAHQHCRCRPHLGELDRRGHCRGCGNSVDLHGSASGLPHLRSLPSGHIAPCSRFPDNGDIFRQQSRTSFTDFRVESILQCLLQSGKHRVGHRHHRVHTPVSLRPPACLAGIPVTSCSRSLSRLIIVPLSHRHPPGLTAFRRFRRVHTLYCILNVEKKRCAGNEVRDTAPFLWDGIVII